MLRREMGWKFGGELGLWDITDTDRGRLSVSTYSFLQIQANSLVLQFLEPSLQCVPGRRTPSMLWRHHS
jgi:hypothetical protein